MTREYWEVTPLQKAGEEPKIYWVSGTMAAVQAACAEGLASFVRIEATKPIPNSDIDYALPADFEEFSEELCVSRHEAQLDAQKRPELYRPKDFKIDSTEPGDIQNKFSVGFAIDINRMQVALIRKNRPKWQRGQLNGVGGHQKVNESPVGCMRREALEEIGLDLPESGQWQQFHYERHTSGNCLSFFVAQVDDLATKVKTMTDEMVEIVDIRAMLLSSSLVYASDGIDHLGRPGSNYVYNLGYLIPMAVTWLLNPEHQYLEG